ncbi:chromosomal replication initiator protein DnaA [Candidatus Peregrinibacteria bacterium CG10_big_fil_rev_8_21_14_0_10_49_24]|nr:MAG: chromosomal replication initiator protein DnaA [Candidatus Peregrinibacteria bacterium CG10_big_fil_rev_8_21_14_0_10_49_24]PJA67624.1 MAG: chromosomal replication initiator protein DnaA [Candidatus Peregrinibacteria bacterium CG_4_9_14_3_um_filter_49_12]
MTSFASSSVLTEPQAVHVSQDIWVDILKALSTELQRGQFITWFRDTAVLGREDKTLIVGLPLPMYLSWHLEHYRALTLEAAKSIDPTIEQIVYKVDGGLKDNSQRSVDILSLFPEPKKRKVPGRQEVKMAEGLISKILNPRYTLDNFVVGSNNRLAQAACQAVAAAPGGKYNPLFLYGNVGLGKTHLLQATGNEILKKDPRAVVLYTTSEDFTNEVVEAIRTQKMEKLRSRYRRVDVLIVDDVQFLANKERTQEEFFHTFNALYEDRKQVILSADRPPQELQLAERLLSRFARGMIADVSMPDYETRLAILVEKAREYEIFMDAKVLEFIAEHMPTNIRELEGILMQAVAQYELEQRMPTVGSIAQIMSKLHHDPHIEEEHVGFEVPEKRAATFQDVMEATSRYYSVSVQDMVGVSRVREILIPRQIAMYIGKKYLRMSYVRLGELFSNRDHTTVMNAVEKIEKKTQNDPQILREMRAIERDLGFV